MAQGLRRYRATEYNIHRPTTPEDELQDMGRQMGAIDAEVRLAASHPPSRCPPSGSLEVNVAALRRAADSPLVGIGGDVGGYSRRRYEGEIAEAEVWNGLVRAGLIVRGDDGRPRSGISDLPETRRAASNELFQEWFRFGLRRRQEEIEAQQTSEAILSYVLLVMELLLLRMGTTRAGVRASEGVSPFRAWFRRQLARLVELIPQSLRSGAQRLVAELIRRGRRVVVNLGGEASPSDIARWGDTARDAINLNPLTVARPQSGIPNLVRADAARIGDLFNPSQVDEIISTRLPPNTLDWQRTIPGAHRVLKPGGRITISFQGVGSDADVIIAEMQRLGFRDIENLAGAVIRAVK